MGPNNDFEDENRNNLKKIEGYKRLCYLLILFPAIVTAGLLLAAVCHWMNLDLNRAGLILNMIGVTLTFFFPPPASHDAEEVVFGPEDATAVGRITIGEFNSTVKRVRKWHRISSSLGFVWLGIGFVIQLFG